MEHTSVVEEPLYLYVAQVPAAEEPIYWYWKQIPFVEEPKNAIRCTKSYCGRTKNKYQSQIPVVEKLIYWYGTQINITGEVWILAA